MDCRASPGLSRIAPYEITVVFQTARLLKNLFRVEYLIIIV